MDGITLQMLITGIVVVVSNIAAMTVALKWLRADIKNFGKAQMEQERRTDKATASDRVDIGQLYNRTRDMMTKSEVIELLSQITGPLQKEMAETRTAINKVKDAINDLNVHIARLDERHKAEERRADIVSVNGK